ncbi:MAG: hypothetical protein HY720_21285 [Planctomycetes bacterium]|nr:hypothetical protein [Planctomycetota bacterium]
MAEKTEDPKKQKTRRLLLATAAAVVVAGAVVVFMDEGGDVVVVVEGPSPVNPNKPKGDPFPEAKATATIKGRVVFVGGEFPKPDPEKVPISGEAHCEQAHPELPASENVVIDPATKGIGNVIVWVESETLASFVYPEAAKWFELDQKDCLYRPHVSCVITRQPIRVKNGDPIGHNVNYFSPAGLNAGANPDQPTGVDIPIKDGFARRDVMRFKCDKHTWMGAWMGVVPHRFFDVTDADGTFELPKILVGSGKWTIRAWWEPRSSEAKPTEASVEVTVEEGKTYTIEIPMNLD